MESQQLTSTSSLTPSRRHSSSTALAWQQKWLWVNCCDSIRRCYDVLRAQGGLDFLFLLDLPHHDDGCA